MPKWTSFPHTGDYTFDAASAKKQWARLHTGDAEPLPKDAEVLKAWVLFHNGDFQKAAEAGLKAGGHGISVHARPDHRADLAARQNGRQPRIDGRAQPDDEQPVGRIFDPQHADPP